MEDPNNPQAQNNETPPADSTTDDGGLMVLVTDSFGETGDDNSDSDNEDGND